MQERITTHSLDNLSLYIRYIAHRRTFVIVRLILGTHKAKITTLVGIERTYSPVQGENTELESLRSQLAATQAKLASTEEVKQLLMK